MSPGPWSLAKVTDNKVAVTLPDERKVVFLRLDPLGVERQVLVEGSCFGVAYSDRKLVVGFSNPSKVEILNANGTVLQRIESYNDGKALFNYPDIVINSQLSLIYVSSFSDSNVQCLRFDGTVVATYNDDELQLPRQAIVDSTGNVLVRAYGSGNVHQITSDCGKIKILLQRKDGLSSPYAISFDESECKLYVGQCKRNNISVYQVTYETLQNHYQLERLRMYQFTTGLSVLEILVIAFSNF